MEKLIARINELAKKSREEGLSEAELAEQAKLRKEYIAKFRQGMENTLSNVYIMDEKGNKKKYAQDILDRLNSGELMHEDSVHYIDSLKVHTLVKGREIYGGGGISPDKFVALDTTHNTKYYRNVMAKGLLNRYAISYVDAHRKELTKRYKNDDAFVADFEVTDKIRVEIEATELTTPAIESFAEYIGGQTLAVEVKAATSPAGEFVVDSDIDEIPLKIAVTKA